MLIKSIHLKNFRNHKGLLLNFTDDLTIIHGPNGIGKTNVLESISILSLGKSPIAVVEKDLISIGESYSRVVSRFVEGEQKEFVINRQEDSSRMKKTFKTNGVVKKVQSFTEGFRSVLFEPADIKLISGSPSRRRDFLDKLLIQVNNDYRIAISSYNRSLKQRNKILEKIYNIPSGLYPSELEIWDNNLIESGVLIQKHRANFFEFANITAPLISKELFPKELSLKLEYLPRKITKQTLIDNLSRDKKRGTTSIGPHLDGFSVFFVNEKGLRLELKNYGSRGQMRMSVLLIKILSLIYLEKNLKLRPVLLLDDIFSEFDDTYRSAIQKIIEKQQTIITTANLNDIPDEIKLSAKIIDLKKILEKV